MQHSQMRCMRRVSCGNKATQQLKKYNTLRCIWKMSLHVEGRNQNTNVSQDFHQSLLCSAISVANQLILRFFGYWMAHSLKILWDTSIKLSFPSHHLNLYRKNWFLVKQTARVKVIVFTQPSFQMRHWKNMVRLRSPSVSAICCEFLLYAPFEVYGCAMWQIMQSVHLYQYMTEFENVSISEIIRQIKYFFSNYTQLTWG